MVVMAAKKRSIPRLLAARTRPRDVMPIDPDATTQDPIDLSDIAALTLPPELLETDPPVPPLPPVPAVPTTLPPEALELDADDVVLGWAEGLEQLDYFTLLGLPVPPSVDDVPSDKQVKDAFHGFALAFHPDRYRGSAPEVRAAAGRVYMRGSEGYRVLQDSLLRKRYVRVLAEGDVRMKSDEIAQSIRGGAQEITALAEMVKSAVARPFALRADELLAAGDFKQARLQAQLALLKEPQNARLQERIREIDVAIKALKAPRKPS